MWAIVLRISQAALPPKLLVGKWERPMACFRSRMVSSTSA